MLYTGCSHHGILNILDATEQFFPNVPIKSVFGGFHLTSPITDQLLIAPDEVRALAQKLRDRSVDKYYSGHCTGKGAMQILQEVLKERLVPIATGSSFKICCHDRDSKEGPENCHCDGSCEKGLTGGPA